jgi:Ni2+-binding GTPase involved in maturation of urease and hydrogenase
MRIHLVGGFLGAGKTTAIIQAAHRLIAQDVKVGVVTNDKGKHLVDTAFFRSAALPTAEVAGGCFRCNFDELEKRINQLKEEARPEVIFAESVGSCADMAATVLEPLLRLQDDQVDPTSFSVFTDARLLRMWLLGVELPFSDEVQYIFEKQIEEAGLLVINKMDLLSAEKLLEVEQLAAERFPDKDLMLQDSTLADGGQGWLDWLNSTTGVTALPDTEIDYDRYDAGGRQLAWLDEQITIWADDALAAVKMMIATLVKDLREEEVPVGHLKFFLSWEDGDCKISFPTLEEAGWQNQLDGEAVGKIEMLVNGRIQAAPAKLNRMIAAALDMMAKQPAVLFEREENAYFRPRILRRRDI